METAKGFETPCRDALRLLRLVIPPTAFRLLRLNKRRADASLATGPNENEIEDRKRLLRLSAEAYRKAHLIA
jgi:hypothetical protein